MASPVPTRPREPPRRRRAHADRLAAIGADQGFKAAAMPRAISRPDARIRRVRDPLTAGAQARLGKTFIIRPDDVEAFALDLARSLHAETVVTEERLAGNAREERHRFHVGPQIAE